MVFLSDAGIWPGQVRVCVRACVRGKTHAQKAAALIEGSQFVQAGAREGGKITHANGLTDVFSHGSNVHKEEPETE